MVPELTTAPPPATVNGTALAVAYQSDNSDMVIHNPLVMPVSPRFVADRYKAIQDIQKEIFHDGVHYGTIPGTGPKKTLLKPGADALCTAFQLSPDFIKQPESVENADHIHLVYKCVLTSTSGRVLATGVGSCNSKEEKYRWTTLARKCPTCGKETIAKSKEEWGGGWYCNAKKDGCGAKFPKGARSIEDQEAGRKENDNAWNFHNTITKMAQKRALVAATITACGISGEFTQDVEDFEQPPAKRPEDTIDIQANTSGWQERAQADDRAHEYGERLPSGESADYHRVPPPVDEFNTFGAGTPTPDLPLWEAPPASSSLPAHALPAYNDVAKELAYCRTKDNFEKLKVMMKSGDPHYLHPLVTQMFNIRYRELFPAQPTAEKKGA